MKKYINLFLIFTMCLVLNGCGKSQNISGKYVSIYDKDSYNDKQLAEISDLKANDIVSKNTIQTLNDTVSNMTSKSKLNAIIGILFAIIEGIVVWYITTKLLS